MMKGKLDFAPKHPPHDRRPEMWGNTGSPLKALNHAALIRAALATIRVSGKRKPFPIAMRYKGKIYAVKCSNFGRVTVFNKRKLLASSNLGAI